MIAVIAASNLAVDDIAETLLPMYEDRMLRVVSLMKENEYGPDHPLYSMCLHKKVEDLLSDEDLVIKLNINKNPSLIERGQYTKLMNKMFQLKKSIAGKSRIILSTSADLGQSFLKSHLIPVIIMDEATQSSEALSLIPFSIGGCEKMVLLGDMAQLSVLTKIKPLETSLFQRVIKNGTSKDTVMLDTQYRMHPDISEFSKIHFYDKKLKDSITASDRAKFDLKYPEYFFNHSGINIPYAGY